MIELLKEILARLYDIRGLLTWGGTLMVCVIVFVETGMFVGFFLPGDSLLVTAGGLCRGGKQTIGLAAFARHAMRHCRRPTGLPDRSKSGPSLVPPREFEIF